MAKSSMKTIGMMLAMGCIGAIGGYAKCLGDVVEHNSSILPDKTITVKPTKHTTISMSKPKKESKGES